ncbi:hypothetical protein SAMN04488556_4243 [Halostagnicola kamekurae]|uniref:Uncharacterized protein n=1 Tax=Halostagnicola kamekurae TaxID=619731 RepID=A0A1I6V160_9EURY|nr:hypothetical protein SAMN04488556_4243 [Halostagnicola kamekurae]
MYVHLFWSCSALSELMQSKRYPCIICQSEKHLLYTVSMDAVCHRAARQMSGGDTANRLGVARVGG